jgi:glucokinase
MKEVAIGIDIGGTFTKYGILDRSGFSLAEGVIPTTDYPEIEGFVEALNDRLTALLKSISNELRVVGVGVGAPNGNYYSGTIEFAPNLKWKGIVPFVEIFTRITGYKTILTNDANAAAIGEMVFGGAKNMRDFIVITLGTGLGSGIVVNGMLVNGHDGFAGELGHTTIDYNGRICGCGRKGCLETYVSATGIKRTFAELLGYMNDESELRGLSYNEIDSLTIELAALKGDPIAKEAYDVTGKYLGYKLADTVAHLSPEAIFILGGLAKAGELIFEPTRRYFEEHLLKVYKNKVKILRSGITNTNAAIAGAGALVWKEFDQQ